MSRRRKRVRQEATARKRLKNESMVCALCTAKVYYETTEEIFSANEKDCFGVVLSLLELSSGSILEIADEWASGEFTFCAKCVKFLKDGMAMMKQVKELQKKIEVIREEVIAVLGSGKRNLQGASKGSQIVRNILKQCFQPCVVPLERATLNPNVDSISRGLRKSTGNQILKQVQCTDVSILPTSANSKSTAIKTESMQKDSMVADYGDLEGEEINYGWCNVDSYGDFNEDINEAVASANGSSDIVKERYCAKDEIPHAFMRTEDTVKESVDVASVEVGSSVADAVSSLRRSLRPRQRKQLFVGNIKVEGVEISKHTCSVCKIEFNEKKELAKHYWSQHSARTAKNPCNLVILDAGRNEAQAPVEQSENSEGDEFLGPSDASSEDSDGDHANKSNSKNRAHKLTRKKKTQKDRKLKCPFCAEMFDTLQEFDFIIHIYDEHKLTFVMDTYGCHKCGEVVGYETSDPKSSESTLSHMNCKESVEANACRFCDYKGQDFIQKLYHYYFWHPSKTNFRCDICETETILSCRRTLRCHRFFVHGIPSIRIPRKFTKSSSSHSASIVQLLYYYYSGRYDLEDECRVCGSSFEGRSRLIHYRDNHNLHFHRGLYGCIVCNTIYDDDEEDNFEEFQECHKKCCPGQFPTKTCACIFCGETFTEFRKLAFHHLRSHFQLNRPPPQKYPCKFCPQTFRHEARVFDHIQKHHRDVELIQLLANSQDCYQDFESEKPPGQLNQLNELLPRTGESSSSHPQEQILAVVESDFWTTEIVHVSATDTVLSNPVEMLNREISAAEFEIQDSRLHRLQLQDFLLQPSDRACLFCDFISATGSFIDLMAHVYASHQLIFLFGLIGCNKCGAVKSKDDLELQEFCKQHSNCVSSPSANSCTVCNFKSGNFFQMMGHYKEAHCNGKISWVFNCGACDRRYCDSVEGVIRHYESIHTKSNNLTSQAQNRTLYPETPDLKPTERERCALCLEVFSKATKQLLPNHVSEAHKLSYYDGIYGCSVCGVLYNANSKCGIDEFAREHEKCCYESHSVSLICSDCGQVFQEFKTLVAHCKSDHEYLNQVWCFVCGESYVSVAVLKAHYHLSNHLQQRKKPEKVDVLSSLYREAPPEGIPCELCDGSIFDGMHRFYAHRRAVHKLVTKYDVTGCLTCEDVFIRKPGYALCDFIKEHEACTRNNETAFDCKLCGKMLGTLESKFSHYSFTHGDRDQQSTCEVCHRILSCPEALKNHMRALHPYPEEEQGKNVIERNQLNSEEQESSPLIPYVKMHCIYYLKKLPEATADAICELCMEPFDPQLPDQLKDHMKNAHRLLLTYIQHHRLYLCACCYVVWKPDENLSLRAFAEDHAMCASVSLEDGIPCKYCPAKCLGDKLLCMHHIKHHVEKTIECAGCTTKFATFGRLFRHMRDTISTHPGLIKQRSSVSNSDVIESTEKLVERHPTHYCPICKTVREKRGMKTHYLNHHSIYVTKWEKREYFACDGCNDLCIPGTCLETELPTFAETHKDCTHHKEIIVCKLCGKQYDYRSRPKYFEHYFIYHVFGKTVCHICGKSISGARGALTRHMLIHNKSHPFTCQICNLGCSNRNRLRSHLLTHTKSKPYICDICGASLSLQSTFIHHRSLHKEQIRNVPCMQCGKLFTNKKNVWSHVRDVHRRSRPPRTRKPKPKKVVEEITSDGDISCS